MKTPRPVTDDEARAIVDDFRRGVNRATLSQKYSRYPGVIDRVLERAGVTSIKPINLLPNDPPSPEAPPATVNNIPTGGFSKPLDFSAAKKATQTLVKPAHKSDYTVEVRKDVINDGFAKAEELLDVVQTTKELREWVSAFTDLVSIRRLEDGDATQRKEDRDITGSRERVLGRINQLVERRRPKVDTERAN